MKSVDLAALTVFVNDHISDFHTARLKSVQKLTLEKILSNKNPYLFRAKNLILPQTLIESIVNAHISSSEEELFGQFLEQVALFIATQVHSAFKSTRPGVDLEFADSEHYYIVQIKSGVKWGNSSQHKKLRQDFETAMAELALAYPQLTPQAVLGICYGKTKPAYKENYLQLVGQAFWHFISGNPQMYLEIIEPLGFRAKAHTDYFLEQRNAIIVQLVGRFIQEYYTDGRINWQKIVEFNSGNGVFP
jgi:hypothetical protein